MANNVLDDKVFEQLKMGDLTDQEKQNFSRVFFDALNTRVNQRLVSQMSQAQQDEYLKLIGEGNEKVVEDFKMQTFPNLHSVVDEEFEKLKVDIATGAENITDQQADATLAEPTTQSAAVNNQES